MLQHYSVNLWTLVACKFSMILGAPQKIMSLLVLLEPARALPKTTELLNILRNLATDSEYITHDDRCCSWYIWSRSLLEQQDSKHKRINTRHWGHGKVKQLMPVIAIIAIWATTAATAVRALRNSHDVACNDLYRWHNSCNYCNTCVASIAVIAIMVMIVISRGMARHLHCLAQGRGMS